MFHDVVLLFIAGVWILVGGYMLLSIFNAFCFKKIKEYALLETVWTIIPGIVLIILGVPSLQLLYQTEEWVFLDTTVKITGHQWYWTYDYVDFKNLEYDSYILPQEELQKNRFRLLEVDNNLVLIGPSDCRLLVTAADVLHAWTLPSLCIKIDAVPGRLNQVILHLEKSGLFYGQCSELCGVNHRFIPIALEVVSPLLFKLWLNINWK